jgi:hypothetical protein
MGSQGPHIYGSNLGPKSRKHENVKKRKALAVIWLWPLCWLKIRYVLIKCML